MNGRFEPRAFHLRAHSSGRLLGRIAGLRVHLVDGEAVRNEIYCDFTMGGNSAIYGFVPEGEIWIDGAMSSLDVWATVLHEIVEFRHMRNRGLAYAEAHDLATAEERKFRERFAGRRRVSIEDVRGALG